MTQAAEGAVGEWAGEEVVSGVVHGYKCKKATREVAWRSLLLICKHADVFSCSVVEKRWK